MQSRDFCYWLQGYFEISNNKELSIEQVNMIKNHLNMVFRHEIDPSMGNLQHQKELNDAHAGGSGGHGELHSPHDQVYRC